MRYGTLYIYNLYSNIQIYTFDLVIRQLIKYSSFSHPHPLSFCPKSPYALRYTEAQPASSMKLLISPGSNWGRCINWVEDKTWERTMGFGWPWRWKLKTVCSMILKKALQEDFWKASSRYNFNGLDQIASLYTINETRHVSKNESRPWCQQAKHLRYIAWGLSILMQSSPLEPGKSMLLGHVEVSMQEAQVCAKVRTWIHQKTS